jgi:ribonuclease P protein component
MNRQFTFSKKERIANFKQIEQLFVLGSSFNNYPLKVIYRFSDTFSGEKVQILIAVPRKRFKRAVDRNKLRRLIREAYRLHKYILLNQMAEVDKTIHIGFVYNGDSTDTSFTEIEMKMIKILEKLVSILL